MKVLVTGGTGVIGRATISELLRRGHAVRLLSRGAEEDAGSWDERVEPFAGNVADPESIRGAAAGCDAVIHVVGIVEEDPPEVTFDVVNVQGTRNIIAEASTAGVRRFVFVSSLGADRGESDYHRSKHAAEQLIPSFTGTWCIARTGAVMGPRDETVSVLLRMMRTLPVVPVIGSGDQQFQPIWHEDVAWALAECLERDDVQGRTLNITGEDVLTVAELLDAFGEATDRAPLRVPVPEFVARLGTSLAESVGVETPVSAATVQMLLEGNFLQPGEANDLTGVLGYSPEPTRARLVELTDDMPEQTPDEGVGRLQRRHFEVDIHGSGRTASDLLQLLARDFGSIVPFQAAAEPGAPESIRDGATLTLELPLRGHVQVRVEQMDDYGFTLATLEGHPLAGIVSFGFRKLSDDVVRFTIDVADRPASRIDQISMTLVGNFAQKRTWKATAESMVEASGGTAPDGVSGESWELEDEEALSVEEWSRRIVQDRERRAPD